MFSTRKEVDDQVHKLLGKLPLGTERDIKGLAVAKLYNKIQEYDKAIEYLNAYLKVKDETLPHKMIAHCYKMLKVPDNNKALQHYQRSIQLNPKQPDVIKDACQILLDDSSVFSEEKAKYWLELSGNKAITETDELFALRVKLSQKLDPTSAGDENTLEMLLHQELRARPQDVGVRVRLLRYYIETKKLDEAFKFAWKMELELNNAFIVAEWYNVVWTLLIMFESAAYTKKDWQFWQLVLITLDRLLYLNLSSGDGVGSTGLSNISSYLFKFDQYLHKYSLVMDKLSNASQHELQNACLEHYAGQVLLHACELLFKRELVNNKNKWKDTLRNALPLMLLGYQLNPLKSESSNWTKHCDILDRKLIELWQNETSFRIAQLGRTLYGCVVGAPDASKENLSQHYSLTDGKQSTGLWDNNDAVLSFVRQVCVDKSWRRQTFQILFTHSEQRLKEQSSLFVRYSKLQEPVYEWPQLADIEFHEQQALTLHPQSLQHHVYLCMGSDNLIEAPRVKYYYHMKDDTKQNLNYCGVDSLSKLDVDTFLYAVVLQAQRKLQVLRNNYDSQNAGNLNAAAKPYMLPFVNVLCHLATEEQANWWMLAYNMYCNTFVEGNRAEQRTQLQYGLEAVRAVNGPRADLYIIFRLGQLLAARSHGLPHSNTERVGLELRVEWLYRQGFNMLKRQYMQQLEPFPRYFKYADSSSTAVWQSLETAAEDAISYFSGRYFKQGKYEEFIDEVRGLQLPMATFMQAEAYRQLEESSKTPRVSRSRFWERRQECLQQTQQLLRNDSDHPLTSVIQGELGRCNQESAVSAARFSLANDSPFNPDLHNNSSTYEDAEDDFYANATTAVAVHRPRRTLEVLAHATPIVSSASQELEVTVKQMNKALCALKDDVGGNMEAMRQDIKTLTDKFATLEELLKKCRISNRSETPTRDVDAAAAATALGLDDLFIMEDALEQQQHQQQQQQQAAMSSLQAMPPFGPGFFNGPQQLTPQSSQERFFTPSLGNLAVPPNAYNSPMYNQPQMYNYYAQYMRTPPVAQVMPPNMSPANMFGPRGVNYGMPAMYPPQAPPFLDPMTAGLNNFPMPPTNVPAPPTLIQPPTAMPATPTPALSAQLLADSKTGFFNSSPSFTTLPAAAAPAAAAAAVQPKPQPVAPPVAAPTLPSNANTALFNRALNNQPVEKEPPANVVITNSDPLPKPSADGSNVIAVQPTLSVTIPPQHIKSSIVPPSEPPAPTTIPIVPTALPTGGFKFSFGAGNATNANTNASANIFSVCPSAGPVSSVEKPTAAVTTSKIAAPPAVTSSTDSIFSGFTTARSTTAGFSFKQQVAQAAADKEKEKQSEVKQQDLKNESASSDLNKSSCTDGSAELDYDPRPDFQGIIPLPDEVEVRTGEEDELVMFANRAKLYRHVDKEWKDRGTGIIKILKRKSGGSRVLMRREQTHKICANHKITLETLLNSPAQDKEQKSFIWVANDFADEELRLEKFLVRFKLPETAAEFKAAFETACKELEKSASKSNINGGSAAVPPVSKPNIFGLAKSNAMTSFATSTPAHTTTFSTATNPLLSKPDSTCTKTAPEAVAKSLFGGQPAVTSAAAAAPSPFANFSFSSGASSKAGTNVTNTPFSSLSFGNNKATDAAVAPTTAPTPAPTPFANISLGNLNSSSTTMPQQQQQQHNKSSSSDAEDEYVPTAQFTPVIPLPELVEVRTGEENELVLFEHRAKLLRFVKESSEWKERGLGNIKLLRDKHNANQVRLLMRRDQVHKLCCNQRLQKDTKFNYAMNSTSALTWAGQDYAEEELSTEMLCVRFKTAEICKQFHDAVLAAQAAMSDEAQPGKPVEQPNAKAVETKGFGDAFKPKKGSWTCQSCYTSNDEAQQYCLACEERKDDTVPPKPATVGLNLTNTASNFSFGFPAAASGSDSATKPGSGSSFVMPSAPTSKSSDSITNTINAVVSGSSSSITSGGFGDAFKPKAGSWSCNACYVSNDAESFYCSACEAPKDDTVPKKENKLGSGLTLPATSSFKFGFAAAPAPAAAAAITTTTAGSAITTTAGSTTNAAFSFGTAVTATKSTPTTTTTATKSLAPPTFGSQSFSFVPTTTAGSTSLVATNTTPALSSNSFSFSMPKSTQQPKSPGNDGEPGGEDYYHEEEENTAYFAPVIALPDKIVVRTGEEDEDLLYVQRAKLYRLYDGEWKERGVGNVKILRHKETKKLRVIMRREQVHKICLNHMLDPYVGYKAKDEKSWLFVVHDFSEGESVLERMTLRFKNAEISKAFYDAIKSALNGMLQPIVEEQDASAALNQTPIGSLASKPQSPQTLTPPPAITTEQKALADKLKLSYDFFTAESKCSGCRGCDPDKFVFGKTAPAAKSLPDLPLILPALKLPQQTATAGAVPAAAAEKCGLIKPGALSGTSLSAANSTGFGGFSCFGSGAFANSTTITSKTDDNKQSNAPTAGSTAPFHFGKIEKPIFGNSTSQSIFGGANTVTSNNDNVSIFGTGVATKSDTSGQASGTSAVDTSKSIFGGTSSGSTGSTLFAGSGSITGNKSWDHVFGSQASVTAGLNFGSGLFSETKAVTFGDLAAKKDTVEIKQKDKENNLSGSNTAAEAAGDNLSWISKEGADFGSLAKSASNTNAFQKSSSGGYFGLTHQDAFQSFLQPGATDKSNNNSLGLNDKSTGDAGASSATDENYDPHYEPIIELPDEIVVTTGEENETKLFAERGVLYRFDGATKQWKERGVGEVKILEHSELNTYRMVMRREQIHKLVLNMKIGPKFSIEYMDDSKKSFIWAYYNYAESTEGVLERLALRFKKLELADKFNQTVTMCIEKAKMNEGPEDNYDEEEQE